MINPAGLEAEELAFIGVCDLSAQVRGKSVPATDMPSRFTHGIGYTPANLCLSAFGTIGPSPFGTAGDIVLLPDASSKVDLRWEGGAREHFYLADITTSEGERWEYCPRDFLRRGLARLEKVGRCNLMASFEQELVYTGVAAAPRQGYSLASFREQRGFGGTLVAALRTALMTPDAFLAEFGARQFEVTVAPKLGLRAADEAVILRELARAVAHRAGQRAIFSPMLEPEGVGNGTHIHLSLHRRRAETMTHDPERPYGLSQIAENFIAGILEHLPALTAITTPSVCSFLRLTPDRWAPTWANIAVQDRAAALRICPGSATQFNVEFRVADATASPYLALGALVHAGVDGIERRLRLPPPTEKPFGAMTDGERRAAGMRPLPRSLGDALELLSQTEAAQEWFGREFLEVYLNFKMDEVRSMSGLKPQAICDRYAAVY